MFVYYFFQALVFIHEHRWSYLASGWGLWYLVEVIGFVLVPCVLFAYAVRNRSLGIVRVAAVMALVGVLLNRLNVSIIAFNWNAAERYVPSWMELVVALAVVFVQIWVLRWVVLRMPVLREIHELPGRRATAGALPAAGS